MSKPMDSEKQKGLGTVLQLLRIANNLSIKELAEKINTSSAYISEIEANKKKPSLELLSKYSEALGVNTSTILYFDEEGSQFGYKYQKLLFQILKKLTGDE